MSSFSVYSRYEKIYAQYWINSISTMTMIFVKKFCPFNLHLCEKQNRSPSDPNQVFFLQSQGILRFQGRGKSNSHSDVSLPLLTVPLMLILIFSYLYQTNFLYPQIFGIQGEILIIKIIVKEMA